MATEGGWGDEQADNAVLRAKGRAGGETGWKLLGPHIQRALVAEEVLRVALKGVGLDVAIRPEHLRDLFSSACDSAGL